MRVPRGRKNQLLLSIRHRGRATGTRTWLCTFEFPILISVKYVTDCCVVGLKKAGTTTREKGLA